MTASTSKFTDRVLQNIKEANDKINEVDSSIENQIRSLIENNIFSKTATEKWKNFYEEYWSELEKEVSGPTHPFGREERQLKDDYFYDSLDNLTFDNENNKQNDLSDDELEDTYWEIETGEFFSGEQIKELEKNCSELIKELNLLQKNLFIMRYGKGN